MDKFPRDKQNSLLIMLYNIYPKSLPEEEVQEFINKFGSEDDLNRNLLYLYGHGLIEKPVRISIDGFVSRLGLKITVKGLDFIRNDGGLSAILNIYTIKIHDETIEQLTCIINKSHLTEVKKKTLIGILKELPEHAIKHLVSQLLGKGLSLAPAALEIISSYSR